MNNKEILTELNELKDNFNKIKTIMIKETTSIGNKMTDKVDMATYNYTEEENIIVSEIEDIIDFIVNAFNKFYN